MKVYTPVKGLSGIWANTLFVNGVGETDNENAIQYFVKRGYILEEQPGKELAESVNPEPGSVIEPEQDFESMTVEELRSWMKAHGLGSEVRNIQNKEKLLDIIRRK